MPNPVSQVQTVEAINAELATMKPLPAPVADLQSTARSNKGWSCNSFAPAVLERVCGIVGKQVGELQTKDYAKGDALPDSFADNTFANVSMMGDPSALNHNFNILVSGGTTYLIQAYVDQEVDIVRRFPNASFITQWKNLADDATWQDAYAALFDVTPAAVLGGDPPAESWLKSQYVTL